MELTELENIWKEYDKKVTDNTRLNKEILRRILISKPERRFNWIKIKAGFNVFSPVILFVLLLIMDVQFQLTVSFYIGLSLFMTVYILTYIWDIKYFLLIRRIDFSNEILTIKKAVAELEKYKIKTTRIKYVLMPFAIAGIFCMLIQKPIINNETIVLFTLIIIVFFSSIYFTFKFSIYERFKMLNREIEEVENIDKE
jgi:uncharacterized membrane protein